MYLHSLLSKTARWDSGVFGAGAAATAEDDAAFLPASGRTTSLARDPNEQHRAPAPPLVLAFGRGLDGTQMTLAIDRPGFWSRGCALAAVLLVVLGGAVGCRGRSEVVVFHATNLRRALGEATERFEAAHPVTVRLEPSGSQVAARKVAELGMRADVVVADTDVLERLLGSRAGWRVELATNELVLAHKDHSRFTDEISTATWPEVLLRPGVRLGRADPETAPLGYETLLVWQLAGASLPPAGAGGPLAERLAAHCAREHVASDETELLALLESRAVDYAFLYRSTAEDHHLKITSLAPEHNLGRRDLAEHYATAAVDVRSGPGGATLRLRGRPITCGLTIPSGAPNPAGARAFAAFLLGEAGRRALERAGFRPLLPAVGRGPAALPDELPLVVRP